MRRGGTAVFADFTRLRSRFPYIAMIPQVEFLDFIVGEARKHACFELRLGARVTDLIRDWQDVHFLSVESSRIPTWHREGLFAIGAAAHVMACRSRPARDAGHPERRRESWRPRDAGVGMRPSFPPPPCGGGRWAVR